MSGALLLMSSFLLQNSSQIHTIPKKKSSLLNKFEKNLRITQDVRQIHGKTCGPVRRGARNRSLVNMHRNSPGITQCVLVPEYLVWFISSFTAQADTAASQHNSCFSIHSTGLDWRTFRPIQYLDLSSQNKVCKVSLSVIHTI